MKTSALKSARVIWHGVRLALLLHPMSASAQMPFLTDDPGVADDGTLHIEVSEEIDALQSMQYPDLRQKTAVLKVNYGLPHGLELDVDVPYLVIDRTAGAPNSNGHGDTNFGLKWNIRDVAPGSRTPGLAVSFYTELPTGDARQELGSGVTDYWLNVAAQFPLSDQTRFNLNTGILFAGNTSTGVVGIETTRGRVYVGGLSALHDFSQKFTAGAEIYGGMADTGGLDRTQLQFVLGGQYAIADGVSLCVGLTAGTYTASPRVGGLIGIAVDFPHLFQPSLHRSGEPHGM